MMARYVRPAVAVLMLAGMMQTAAAASPIEGTWLTAAKSEITISPCPDDFCGDITKVVVPADIYNAHKQAIDQMDQSKFTDQLNKDPSLRSRPILGLQILTMHPGDKPARFDGQIYNPQDGNSYSGFVEILGPNKIRLNGCILYNVVCKGEEWTRVPQPEASTAGTAAAPAPAASGGTAAASSFQ